MRRKDNFSGWSQRDKEEYWNRQEKQRSKEKSKK